MDQDISDRGKMEIQDQISFHESQVVQSGVAIGTDYKASLKTDLRPHSDRTGSVSFGTALIVTLFITAFFISWVFAVDPDFHAQGEDSTQFIEIARILEGKFHAVTTLDSLPAGVLNRTPVYPVFLWIAGVFAGGDAKWLTVIANSLCVVCTLPLVLKAFGSKFSLSAAVISYIILAFTIRVYFITISAEWLCMHLLLVIGAVFLDTRGLAEEGAGFRLGLCCSCAVLCRPAEIGFVVVAPLFFAFKGNFKECANMLVAFIPVALQIALQSYIAGFLTLSQCSIIADYILTSQLGEVSIRETDSEVLKAFIIDANQNNFHFNDQVLRECSPIFGVCERSTFNQEGVKNQDRPVKFLHRWNLNLGEIHRLVLEYSKRARNEHPFRLMQYLLSLWPLGGTLVVLTGSVILMRKTGFAESESLLLMGFYLSSIYFIIGYSAFYTLPVTRYVLIQVFPLLHIFLIRIINGVVPDVLRLHTVIKQALSRTPHQTA